MRIDESRESLVQKIEQLEEKVTESVELATASVAEATGAVMETVQNATTSVSETVDTVTGAVQGTVDTVRESVEGAVDSIKEAFDLTVLVERHPWFAFAGSVGVGFLVEKIIENTRAPSLATTGSVPRAFVANEASLPESAAFDHAGSNGHAAPRNKPQPLPNLLGDAFGPEIAKLKSLAIGAGLSGLKEVLIKYVPTPLQRPLETMIDQATERLGGEPLHGSLFTEGMAPNRPR